MYSESLGLPHVRAHDLESRNLLQVQKRERVGFDTRGAHTRAQKVQASMF